MSTQSYGVNRKASRKRVFGDIDPKHFLPILPGSSFLGNYSIDKFTLMLKDI